MRERKSDGRFEDVDQDRQGEEDRRAVLVALMLAAVSGFVMGLIVHGEAGLTLLAAFFMPSMGFAGWWLRGAFEQDRLQTEP